jgi:hypothetical protein
MWEHTSITRTHTNPRDSLLFHVVVSITNTLVIDYVSNSDFTCIYTHQYHTQLNFCCNTKVMSDDDINYSFVQDEFKTKSSWTESIWRILTSISNCYLASYHLTLILRVTRTVRIPDLTNRSINLNCAVTPNVLTEFTQAGKVNDKHQKVKTGYNSLKGFIFMSPLCIT